MAVVSVVLLALLVACGADVSGHDPQESRPWGAAAEEWLSRIQEAGTEGTPNLEPFLAPGVVVDHRATGGPLARGVAASLAMARGLRFTHPGLLLQPPPYVSRTGLIVPASWRGPGLYSGIDAVLLMRITPRGLVREESLPSLVSGADRVSRESEWSAALDLVERYLAERSAGGAELVVQSLGRGRGPAVYAAPDGTAGGFRRVVALLRTEDPGECPGRLAISMGTGEDGRSAVEELRRVDDGRRCLHGAARYDGWWTRMTVPDPVQHVRTGIVTVGGLSVEVWNGTPALESLVEWALTRYLVAGLGVPPVASVTFYPNADRCQGNLALAYGPRRDTILACFGEGLACVTSPCPPWSDLARTVVLHELAHTWLQAHVGADERAAYERLVGLRWEDPADPWESRAVERATEVVAQGVRAEPPPHHLLEIPRASLVAEFTMLTGEMPVPLVR